MKRILFTLAFLPVIAFSQDKCPSFKVSKTRSHLHYDFKLPKYRVKRFPSEGMAVFAGAYAGNGTGWKFTGYMIEYGIGLGWQTQGGLIKPNTSNKKDAPEYVNNIYAATISAFSKPNDRVLLDGGIGYGSVMVNNKNTSFMLHGTTSYRFYRNTWMSGSIQLTSIKQLPYVQFGLSTLLWK